MKEILSNSFPLTFFCPNCDCFKAVKRVSGQKFMCSTGHDFIISQYIEFLPDHRKKILDFVSNKKMIVETPKSLKYKNDPFACL
jgi:hypothetical protein